MLRDLSFKALPVVPGLGGHALHICLQANMPALQGLVLGVQPAQLVHAPLCGLALLEGLAVCVLKLLTSLLRVCSCLRLQLLHLTRQLSARLLCLLRRRLILFARASQVRHHSIVLRLNSSHGILVHGQLLLLGLQHLPGLVQINEGFLQRALHIAEPCGLHDFSSITARSSARISELLSQRCHIVLEGFRLCLGLLQVTSHGGHLRCQSLLLLAQSPRL
mmetsp:Transcript_7870/g.20997  ORF Transcript_7870/g.20997 Transcript_7870/m.20997 type:complete len:220 (-) Transcript_7870:739-1398(-)